MATFKTELVHRRGLQMRDQAPREHVFSTGRTPTAQRTLHPHLGSKLGP
jgi:hypothetical protein